MSMLCPEKIMMMANSAVGQSSGYDLTEYIPAAVTALVGIAGILAQVWLASKSSKDLMQRDRSRIENAALATFYNPLDLSVVPLLELLKNGGKREFENLDPLRPTEGQRIRRVSIFCEKIESVFGAPGITCVPIGDIRMSDLTTLRSWASFAVARARGEELGSSCPVKQKDIVDVLEKIHRVIGEQQKLFDGV